ncbi:retrovirus-related pol polyprotein from transposon TNT 1-94 [Tanacetum coccineum]
MRALRKPTVASKSKVVQIVLWYLDSGCSKHMTGDRSQLTNFVNKFLGIVKFGNDHVAKILGYGDYQIGNVTISRVYYVEGLEGVNLLTGSRGKNLYTLSLGDMMASSPICLLSIASKTKSWLWNRRLSHLNFGAINHLARHGIVRGLHKLKFEKDHLCSACAVGKSKKKPHKPKSKYTNQEKLYLLHMDLCGPMRVASVNEKKYILVIVNDYSRLTWVKCLRSKDEASDFIIKKVGISHETSVARSSQQNGVVERRNRTLIEAACTMLIYAKAPLFLWAEAVATAYFDELTTMASEHSSLGPALYEMTPVTISLALVLNPPLSTQFVPPSRTDWDILFQPLFDELLNPLSSVDRPAPKVIALIAEVVAPEPAVSTSSPSSTTIDQDASSPNVAHMNNDPIFGIPIPKNYYEASSSSDVIPTIVHTATPYSEHITKWTNDHPLENIIVEPKNYKDALTQACWIEAMQEELHGFERLEVWELVSLPDKVMVITLEWIYKTAFLNGILREEVYGSQPDRFVDQDNPNHVYKLKKALYRLKQAPHAWYDLLSKFLLSQEFSKGTVDPTLFIRRQGKDIILKYGMESSDPVDTPMVEKSKLDEDTQGKAIDPTHYRGMIGTLMYLTAHRLDLTFSVCMCACLCRRYHAGCQDTRRSTSGCMQLLGERIMRSQLTDYGLGFNKIPIFHFIKEQVENGVLELYFVNMKYQLADIFTKSLCRERIEFLINKLGMRSFTLETLKLLADEAEE